MANIIAPKRSGVASAAPTTANLADGEIAINYTDKKVYQRVGGTVYEVANYFSGAFSDLSGKPTTLSGYGITDAVPRTVGDSISAGYWHHAAAAFGSSSSAITGTLVIKTAIPAGTSVMSRFEVRGYDYLAATAGWRIDASAYIYSTSTAINHSVQVLGSPPSAEVRAANSPDGYKCILIGLDSTIWRYPKIIVDAMLGHSGSAAMAEGWTMSIVADTSAYINKTLFTHNQPISNITGLQNELDAKAPLVSPTFTGAPAAPTAAVGTNTTQLATTAFVNTEIANDAPSKTGTGASGTWAISISGIAAAANLLYAVDDRDVKPNATGLTAIKAIRPFFVDRGQIEGGPASADYGDFVVLDTYADSSGGRVNALFLDKSTPTKILHYQADSGAAAWLAPRELAYTDSPDFTGNPTAPTQAPGNNSTRLANTAFVTAAVAAGGGGTVGFEIDGGNATTSYAGEPAFDFGSAA